MSLSPTTLRVCAPICCICIYGQHTGARIGQQASESLVLLQNVCRSHALVQGIDKSERPENEVGPTPMPSIMGRCGAQMPVESVGVARRFKRQQQFRCLCCVVLLICQTQTPIHTIFCIATTSVLAIGVVLVVSSPLSRALGVVAHLMQLGKCGRLILFQQLCQ